MTLYHPTALQASSGSKNGVIGDNQQACDWQRYLNENHFANLSLTFLFKVPHATLSCS